MPEENDNQIQLRSAGAIDRRSDLARRGMNAFEYVSGLAVRQQPDLQPGYARTEVAFEFVRAWDIEGGEIGKFVEPSGIALDADGNVYVAVSWDDPPNDGCGIGIQVFDPYGGLLRQWRVHGDGYGPRWPNGIALDADGNVYITDQEYHRIHVFDAQGQFLRKWGTEGSGDGELSCPSSLAFYDVDGGIVYVADTYNHRIQIFDSEGQFREIWGSEGSGDGQFLWPCGLAVDWRQRRVFVSDLRNYRIQIFAVFGSGAMLYEWGSEGSADGQFNYATDLALDRLGNLFVVDQGNNRIQVLDPEGQFLGKLGTEGNGDGQFRQPHGLAVDRLDNVYVVDQGNNRIQVFKSVVATIANNLPVCANGHAPASMILMTTNLMCVWGCPTFPDCSKSMTYVPNVTTVPPQCPDSGPHIGFGWDPVPMILICARRLGRRGPSHKIWQCSKYPDCTHLEAYVEGTA